MTVNWTEIEQKWRKIWDENSFHHVDPNDKQKKFITVAYPYPNSPQHIGHGRTYTIADVHARFYRMRGYNVLFPMGFHYTGTPILAMADRIQDKDQKLVDDLHTLYDVPRDVVDTFVDPVKIADYFHTEIKQGMIEMGYSIDWRREFTTIDPGYKKFISWQIQLLRNKNFITQGSHPVGWCPRDENPVSQHDTRGDVEPSFTEYILAQITIDDYTIPAATLRPETIYGVTNLWINPNIEYQKISVNGSKWIVSKPCSYKLSFLNYDIKILSTVMGSELIGKTATVTATNQSIMILPAEFVKDDTGTGIVLSVPAHAPYDMQALIDLTNSKDETLRKQAMKIQPIKIITTSSDSTMQQVLKEFKISSQTDPKLEDATKQVYAEEFHNGKMLSNTSTLAGMTVKEARDRANDIQNCGIFLEMTNSPVHCRCGALCVVKILQNQWFLDYSNLDWKKLAKECFDGIDIKPKEIRQEFEHVLDWIRQRACARQHGLGTKIPWDPDWIVESLADSVIYMAYYTLAKFVNSKDIDPIKLNDEFFNYVFLGNGDPNDVSAQTLITLDKLNEIKKEFEYFYPVDFRHSGRDLVPNHLLFFVLNHTAIFPKKNWPHGIVVNGSVLMDGKKMSKSMGNTIPLRNTILKHGADPIRLSIIGSAELLQDADFDTDSVQSMQHRLESILKSCNISDITTSTIRQEDKWILSRLSSLISQVTHEIENMRLREALHKILFTFEKDLIWYKKRIAMKNRDDVSGIFYNIVASRVQLLAPFAPYMAEEMWSTLKNDSSVFLSSWPKPQNLDPRDTFNEDLLKNIIFDIEKILKVTKITPKKIILYTATTLKYNVYNAILNMASKNMPAADILKSIFNDEKFNLIKNDANFIKKTTSEILSKSPQQINIENSVTVDEKNMLKTELTSFEKEFDAQIIIYDGNDSDIYDPQNKSKFARPFKPAILVE